MSEVIKVAQITKFAMTEEAGRSLREKIEVPVLEGKEVVLDFEGISLFATPFFNASIGFFVMKLTPQKVKEIIKVENLSGLGLETYGHSLENAVKIYENNEDTEVIGKITADTIEGK